MNNQNLIAIIEKHIDEHTASCTYSTKMADGSDPRADFCSCCINKRQIGLYNDIAKLFNLSLYEKVR